MRYFSEKTRIFLTGALSGSLFGAVLTLSVHEQYAIIYSERKEVVVSDEDHSALENKYIQVGYPSSDNIRVTSSYASAFSPFLRTPLWVMEYVSKESLDEAKKHRGAAGSREKSTFSQEKSINEPFRATNADYQCGSELGLSRGHLAPAQMHKGTQMEMDDTFNLSLNIVPQLMSTNGCDWFRLEQMVKKLVIKYDESWVITGPAFIPKEYETAGKKPNKQKVWRTEYNLIGERRVAVPTHIFKVVLGKKESLTPDYHCAAFILPNGPISDEAPMRKYQIDINELENLTGLSFFPRLRTSDAAKKTQESRLPQVPLLTSELHEFTDMCRKNVCEGSYGSFSKLYRHLSKMQSAQSSEELERLWATAMEAGYTKKLEKDYQSLRQTFTKLLAEK